MADNPTESASAPDSSGATAAAVAAASEVGRSLIVDEAFFEEQFLRCQVCHEKFELTERAPKSLPCNHTFCLPCLTQIFDHAQPPARRNLVWADDSLDGALKCPTCRVEIFLSRNKINELPNDHRVVQMMDFLSQAVAKSQNACSKHDRQPLNFFCKKCLVPVCRDCTVLDHKEGEGHNIMDVSKALNENSGQFDEIEKKSRETLEKMKGRSDSLANASKRLDILERRLRNEIKETFIEYRLLLEKRQEALTSMVQDIVKEKKTIINTRFVNVCETGTQLQKYYDEFKASRKSNDIQKLFTIQQKMNEQDNEFSEVAAHNDTELFHSCEFEAQNEGCFLSDLSSLGEVRTKPDLELKEPVSAHQLVVLDMEKRRERQNLINQHLAQYPDCDEHMLAAASEQEAVNFDSDEAQDSRDDDHMDELEMPHLSSRLIQRYANLLSDTSAAPVPESGSPNTSSSRRSGSGSRSSNSRRGRRTRDTNSSQVTTSFGIESPNYQMLHEALAAAEEALEPRPQPAYYMQASSSPSSSSSSRNRRSDHSYRVVRHRTNMPNRHPMGDDSS